MSQFSDALIAVLSPLDDANKLACILRTKRVLISQRNLAVADKTPLEIETYDQEVFLPKVGALSFLSDAVKNRIESDSAYDYGLVV